MSLVPKHIQNLSPYKPGMHIETAKRKYGFDKVIKLASNENPIGPSPKAIQNIKKNLSENHRYPDSYAYLLREKLSKKFNVSIENVVLGSGSEGIMSTIMRTFLNQDDEIIGVENSFIGFRVLANSSGNKIRWIKMRNYQYDLKAISNKINNNTKIIYLANPDNPTGSYFSKTDFEKFMKLVPQRVLVILDEAYFEYANNIEDYPDSMKYRFDNVITLRTFSKCYGLAGLRVGYGFAHHNLISNLMKVKLPFEPSLPAQQAAIAAMKDSQHLNQTINLNNSEKEIVLNALNNLNIRFIESSTNFITLIFDNVKQSSNFTENMLKNGVIVRHLSSFGLPECVRVSIGTPEENKFYIQVLNNIIEGVYETI
tara:strand:+ start:421 stop:1527 length:1107 start_codon:yes stop_codon:yes gene_type:complete